MKTLRTPSLWSYFTSSYVLIKKSVIDKVIFKTYWSLLEKICLKYQLGILNFNQFHIFQSIVFMVIKVLPIMRLNLVSVKGLSR